LKSALSTFQTAVRKLKDPGLFKTHQAFSANESILKVSAGAGSVAGSHNIQVLHLAKAQKSIAAAEFLSPTDVVGNGELTFSGGVKTPFSITIDNTNNTLAGIRDAINSASDNNGVTASIVNVNDSGGNAVSKLVLTAKDTGKANGFSVAVNGDAGLSRLDSATTTTNYTGVSAVDAEIQIDGLTAIRSSNQISDVLPGLTLNLQSAAEGTDVNVDIKLDNQAIKQVVSDFVTAYNSFIGAADKLGKVASDGTSNGALVGDSTLRSIRNDLRQQTSSLVSSAPNDFNTLKTIGIDIDRYGVMTLDAAKLEKALSTNLSAVSDIFASENGVASKLDEKVRQYLQTGGSLDTRQSSLQKQLTSLGKRRENIQLHLDNLQKNYQKQFIAMDVAVGRFQATGSFLTNQLAQFNK
jgi:flagellar hook-associated protein 2